MLSLEMMVEEYQEEIQPMIESFKLEGGKYGRVIKSNLFPFRGSYSQFSRRTYTPLYYYIVNISFVF